MCTAHITLVGKHKDQRPHRRNARTATQTRAREPPTAPSSVRVGPEGNKTAVVQGQVTGSLSVRPALRLMFAQERDED
jgi:hypothetical protein